MQLTEFYERLLPATGRYALFQNLTNVFFDTLDELVAATDKRINTQGLYFATASYGDLTIDKPDHPQFGNYRRTQDNVVAIKAFRIDIDAGEAKFAKHPEGAYPTQRDALVALVAWIKTTGLMPTLIVSSGEGLHVYWQLTEDVQPTWWKPVAAMLHQTGRAHDLRIDPACTSDEARVLRPVGTPHKNGTRVTVLRDTRKVWEPADFEQLVKSLAPEQSEFDIAVAAARPRAPSINDDILAREGPPASLARVAEHCSAVAAMRDSGGNIPEPHWRAVMGVAKYCEDGVELVHEWSSSYDGYSARETQEKFDRWETPPTTCQHFSLLHSGCNTCKYRGKITTPKQVGYIAVAPAVETAAIPDASPAPAPAGASFTTADTPTPTTGDDESAGMSLPDDEAPPLSADCPVPDRPDLFDPASPFHYVVADNRWTLFHRYKEASKDATGQTIWVEHVKPVAYKLFWVDSNSLPGATESGGVLIQFGRVERPGSPRQDRMDMPAGVSADVKALCKYLVDQGVNLAPRSLNKNATEHIKEYVGREIIRKQNDMRFVLKDRFGYHFHEGQFICALGQYTVYPDGTVLKTICNSKLQGLAKVLTTGALPPKPGGKWDATVWRDLAPHVAEYIQFLRRHYGHPGYAKARLAIACNLASPFLVFAADSAYTDGAEDLPSTGFILSLFSEASGIGKSSMMAAIAAAYGKDTFARKGNDASITPVAAATIAQNSAIYPFLLDEVTQNDAKKAAAMIDTFSNGLGRVRARSDGAVVDSARTWSMVSTVATNVPQRELLTASQKQSNALLMRLMELNLDDMPRIGDIEGFRRDLKGVQAHCGAFGMFQALVAVKTGREALIQRASANVAKAFTLMKVDQTFRFYARMLGAVLTMHELLGKWSPFDMDELIATFTAAVHDTTWYVQNNKTTPEGELGGLLSHLSPGIIVTKTWTKRTGRGDGADVILNPHVRFPLTGREVQDWGCVLLDCGAVREWCLSQQMSVSGFLKKMEDAGILMKDEGKDRARVRLTTGIVNMPTQPGYYYKFRTRPAEASENSGNVVELRPHGEAPRREENTHVELSGD